MNIKGFVWFTDIIDKLEVKHGLTRVEVENIFTQRPLFSKIQKGRIKGENLYRVLGQTESGRYIVGFFVYKTTHQALVISARDMTDKEKKYYAKKKQNR